MSILVDPTNQDARLTNKHLLLRNTEREKEIKRKRESQRKVTNFHLV